MQSCRQSICACMDCGRAWARACILPRPPGSQEATDLHLTANRASIWTAIDLAWICSIVDGERQLRLVIRVERTYPRKAGIIFKPALSQGRRILGFRCRVLNAKRTCDHSNRMTKEADEKAEVCGPLYALATHQVSDRRGASVFVSRPATATISHVVLIEIMNKCSRSESRQRPAAPLLETLNTEAEHLKLHTLSVVVCLARA